MYFLTQESELKIIDNIQVLYFYHAKFPFHQKFLIMIEKIQKSRSDILFSAIDTDYFKTLCKRFTVDRVPTVLILKNGKEIKRINNLVTSETFKNTFDDI